VRDARGISTVNEILSGLDADDTFGSFGVERVRVTLVNGQTINVSGLTSVTFTRR